ncbi:MULTISPECIES: glutamate--cysteine ligase [Gammaproteobacteria]|uniref:glutamate--cysteine ligase n=1 Tax=Gammaproteobacteria TaxID=1236 RepID=UPI000DD032E0|nr:MULTISPECIES: glutamate--cysteine ligase [Gammaproteobacteria]RTE87555.1 glutamate--cysteine ligase [Aliidiomarina sp. B3213]TCZ93412.1 glutamate--cysteine ligase [Lysobacter sp. N42]
MQLHYGLAPDALLELPEIRSSLQHLQRGIEREALRITPQGRLATTLHPESQLGATLTHPHITTDYAEALMEFITPVARSVQETLAQLRDLHRITFNAIGDELLWPLSMPCYVNELSDIRIAQYGSSHTGQMKQVYRKGLTHRYGAMMQTIAGVHYNFSVPDSFWKALSQANGEIDSVEYRSSRYFALIRNFKRLAWVIPYFFGASPLLCQSFLKHANGDLELEKYPGGWAGLPYATSLRMSDLGYTNKEQAELGITYNSLEEYVAGLRRAVFTPSKSFEAIGVRAGDDWKQLNSNILQIENEFYSPIRPKQVAKSGETPTQALERGGVEYIEVRALDVNPWSSVGITETQMRFLDMFLLHCLISPSADLSIEEQLDTERLVTEVVLEGRKPHLVLTDEAGAISVQERLENLFEAFQPIAEALDESRESTPYHDVINELTVAIEDPEQTMSGKLSAHLQNSVGDQEHPAMVWAEQYKQQLQTSSLEFYTSEHVEQWREESLSAKAKVEQDSEGSFAEFLEAYFNRAQEKKQRAEWGALK